MKTSFATTTEALFCAPSDPPTDHPPGIKVVALPTAEEVAEQAAQALLHGAFDLPGRPLGLATGRTMAPVYGAFAALVRELPTVERMHLCQHWQSFNLDEYVGLGPASPGSFAAEMEHHLRKPLVLPSHQVHLPDGLAADPGAEALRYRDALRQAGGVGLQLLGLGLNGHVGFNEPPCGPDSQARCVDLCPSTRQANASAFGGLLAKVPTQAITLGLSDILRAQRILLVVTGAAKAPILQRLLHTRPTHSLPASWLHLHPATVLLADSAALGS